MANTSSAKKANRSAVRRGVFNARRKRAVKDALKATTKLIAAKDAKGAAASLPALYKALDKAAKGHTIHRNIASRTKARLTKRVGALAK